MECTERSAQQLTEVVFGFFIMRQLTVGFLVRMLTACTLCFVEVDRYFLVDDERFGELYANDLCIGFKGMDISAVF